MSPSINLANLRDCFEGIVPACVATCDLEGIPNVTYVSQAIYVDQQHIALSFQFFLKRSNDEVLFSIKLTASF